MVLYGILVRRFIIGSNLEQHVCGCSLKEHETLITLRETLGVGRENSPNMYYCALRRTRPAARCSGPRAAGTMGDDHQRQVYQLNQLPENQVRPRLIHRRASPPCVARARRSAASLVVPTGFSERASSRTNGTPPRARRSFERERHRGETPRRRRDTNRETFEGNERLTPLLLHVCLRRVLRFIVAR